MLQMSAEESYVDWPRMTSGGLYQRVKTCGDISRLLPFFPSEFESVSDLGCSSKLDRSWIVSMELRLLVSLESRQAAFGIVLAKPKSHILIEQSSFIKILAGFKSLCITLA